MVFVFLVGIGVMGMFDMSEELMMESGKMRW